MIYHDKYASEDFDDCPADREEKCLNCTHDWDDHQGWLCPDSYGEPKDFSDCPTDKRYLTLSMKDSLKVSLKTSATTISTSNISSDNVAVDLNDWKTWRGT